MEENQNKVISIRLVNIILVVIVIIGIIFVVNKVKSKKIVAVATIESKSQEEILRTGESTTSRFGQSSRLTSSSGDTMQEEVDTTIENQENETEDEDIQVDNQEKISQEQENEKIAENIVYTAIEDVTISEKMDLTERTGLSRDDFIKLISMVKQDTTKFFYDNAGLIYDLCEKYSINEIFFCGLISAESGWNIASNHRSTYNYISLMTNGKLKSFSSVEDGLEQAAKALHDNYLTPGGKFYNGKTLSGVKTKFCPNSSTWTSLVYGRMKQIVNSI